ncbi:MAG TPA: hybrid sensor histidine kinase/response regulator [Anaerolineae bacterium]|nr:hybrid sensor histidine kinase/response regulator [Anaerolineae bacterium]
MTSSKPKILMVDDKPANLYAMEQLLGSLEVTLISTASGVDALGLAVEHEFCMAIVDVQMPGMDGYELVELLRGNASTATLPIIFVSAIYSDEYHHRKGYDAGAVDFLSKPFVPEILLSKVKIFLALYNQRQQLQTLVQQLNTANVEITRFNQELERRVQERTAELERAYQSLELLDRNKSDFIQVISHELRTPLTLIQGYSQMLLRDAEKQEDKIHRQRAEGIVSGAQRLHEIVDGMLDIVKIDNRTLQLHFHPVSIPLILESLVTNLAKSLQERQLTLTVDPLLTLPTITADIEALTKMFNHLLFNAIKYTPDGGHIRISGQCLSLSQEAVEFVELIIADTGIGIAPEVQELIFTKFYHVGDVAFHSSGKTKFKGGGPGLGLAIVKGVVEAHGGRIWVNSPGYDEESCPGSEFHIVLPVSRTEFSTDIFNDLKPFNQAAS